MATARVFLVLCGLLLAAGPVSAHALGAECKLAGDRVAVEAYYDDDTPARDARVSVLGPDKNALVEGRTDSEGRWSFARPRPGDYEVVVDAGGGHRVQVGLTIPAEATTAVPQTISSGPTRAEFTTFPWSKVALGLAAIACMGLGWWLARRPRPHSVRSNGDAP
jgi:nickel transport protein